MIDMLCRNRVADFAKWKGVFDSHSQPHRDAGLHLKNGWRDMKQPDNVFFLFEVTNIDKAREFISNPAAAEAGKSAGVLDGEYHFLESSAAY